MFPLKCIWPTKWIAFILPRSCKVNHESLRTFQITVWLMTRLSQNSLAMANLQLQGWEDVNLQLRQQGPCQQGPLRAAQRQQHPREGRPPSHRCLPLFPPDTQPAPPPKLLLKELQVPAVPLGKGRPPMLSTIYSSSPPSPVTSVPQTLRQRLTTRALQDETCSDWAAEERDPLCALPDAVAGLKNNTCN